MTQLKPNQRGTKKMYCKQCGSEIIENQEVCQNCGATLNNTKSKSTTIAIVLSILCVGLGQIYNGQIIKGIALLFACSIGFIISPILWIIVWAYGVWDAYSVAKGTQRGIPKEKTTSTGVTFVKGFFYSIVILFGLMCIGAFIFGMGEGGSGDSTSPASTPSTTPIPTQQEFFTPHGKYAEYYIPSITEIGNGKDWYMTKKETKVEGAICTATYTKDGHRTVVISISVFPTVDGAKEIYNERLSDAPYVECPTMGVCDQSFQYVKEVPTSEYGTKEVGTGIIRDGNIIAIFYVTEDNMFFGLNSNDMERYAKNIEKKIN